MWFLKTSPAKNNNNNLRRAATPYFHSYLNCPRPLLTQVSICHYVGVTNLVGRLLTNNCKLEVRQITLQKYIYIHTYDIPGETFLSINNL
jgi:hypothetical protein